MRVHERVGVESTEEVLGRYGALGSAQIGSHVIALNLANTCNYITERSDVTINQIKGKGYTMLYATKRERKRAATVREAKLELGKERQHVAHHETHNGYAAFGWHADQPRQPVLVRSANVIHVPVCFGFNNFTLQLSLDIDM